MSISNRKPENHPPLLFTLPFHLEVVFFFLAAISQACIFFTQNVVHQCIAPLHPNTTAHYKTSSFIFDKYLTFGHHVAYPVLFTAVKKQCKSNTSTDLKALIHTIHTHFLSFPHITPILSSPHLLPVKFRIRYKITVDCIQSTQWPCPWLHFWSLSLLYHFVPQMLAFYL